MGENARVEKISYALNFIGRALEDLGYESGKSLLDLFNVYYSSIYSL